jgi:hypothetical protein
MYLNTGQQTMDTFWSEKFNWVSGSDELESNDYHNSYSILKQWFQDISVYSNEKNMECYMYIRSTVYIQATG